MAGGVYCKTPPPGSRRRRPRSAAFSAMTASRPAPSTRPTDLRPRSDHRRRAANTERGACGRPRGV